MLFDITWAQMWEVVLVDCGHVVANNALNMDDIIPVFQERAIFGVVRTVCFGRLGEFVPSLLRLS